MRSRTALLLLAPAVTIVAVMFLLPLALVALSGFWSQRQDSWTVDQSLTLLNYRRLLGDPYFARVIGRTLRISLTTMLSCLLLGFPVALWIARSAGQRRGLLLVLTLLPLVCGPLVQTLGLINLLGSTGVVNGTLREAGLIRRSVHLLGNEWGVQIGLVQAFLPLMVLPIAAQMRRIPPELQQAASTLGASGWRVMWRITAPLALPGMVSGCILVFAGSLTAFVTPQLLGQGHVQMFGPLVYQQAMLVLNWPFASALAVLMLACVAVAVAAGAVALRYASRLHQRP